MSERLERSVLLVPASNWSMIQKTAASRADAVCIDLEDAVTVDEKEASRANVARAFKELDFGNKLRMYRINGLDTHYAYRDLIDVVEAAGDGIDLIVVPKVNRPEDVYVVETLLTQIESYRKFARPIGIEALIETALGCVNIREIAACSSRLEGFIYGPGDYAAYPGHRWHHIMHSIISAARAYNKRAIDGPFAGIKNPEGLAQACKIARAMGFDGKWCIHPSQIDPMNQTFVPSEKELTWAQTVLNEYELARQEGRGALSVKGKMIDVASLRMCQTTVERARLAGLLS